MEKRDHPKRRVQWGTVTLGEGMPAVCVPVMGKDEHEMGDAARKAGHAGADVLELRIDSLSPMPPLERVRACCAAARRAADRPLLLTLRTQRDGGLGGTDAAQYEALLCRVVSERLCEAIDVELSVGEERFSRVVRAAHASGVSVVGSSHRFDGTPEAGKMIRTLRLMEQLEADVCKIAVMPHSREDVLTLMEAGIRADAQLTVPLIAIAMGPLGILTRLGAQWLGSCLTFGTAGQESAPGQMEAGALRRGLEMVSTALPHG